MMQHDLSPQMLDAIVVLGRGRALTLDEIGVGSATMTGLIKRGMAFAERDSRSPFYQLTPAGKLFLSVLRGDCYLTRPEFKVAQIKQAVAAHFGIPVAEMVSQRRSRSVARPRQIAMYLAKKHTPKSLPSIGRLFGNRDHTTVIHALQRIDALRAEDSGLDQSVLDIENALVDNGPVNAFHSELASA